MQKFALSVLCFSLLNLAIFSLAHAQLEGDWQLWNIVSAEKKMNDSLRFNLEEETRWSEDINRFMYQSLDTGLVYGVSGWLDLGGNFRYVIQDDAGQWEHESRPHLNAMLKYSWRKLQFLNRSRFEYRYLTRTKDTWRYRNLSEIMLPFDWASLKISPYLKEEVFFKFDQDDYNQNRLSGGMQFELLRCIEIDLFYLWQRVKSLGEWKNINVLGTNIKFIF